VYVKVQNPSFQEISVLQECIHEVLKLWSLEPWCSVSGSCPFRGHRNATGLYDLETVPAGTNVIMLPNNLSRIHALF